MKDEDKTREQLIREVDELRLRIAALEETAAHQVSSEKIAQSSEKRPAAAGPGRMGSDSPEVEVEEQTDLESTDCQTLLNLLRRETDERKKAEDALRAGEERFRRLAEKAPDVIYRYELFPARRFTYISPAVKFLTDFSPEDYYADPDLGFKLVHPEDRPLLESILCPGGSGTSASPAVLPAVRWIRKDGTVVWTEEHTVPIYDKSGRLVAIEGVGRNISMRKLAEEALQNAYQQLLGIIDFLPDATFVVDRRRRVIAWNRAIEEMTGVAKEDIVDRCCHSNAFPFYGDSRAILLDLVFGGDPEDAGRYGKIERKGDTLFAEAYAPNMYAGKGAYLWVTASPLFDRNGNIIGAIESIRDITEHKLAEARSHAIQQNLTDIIDFLPDATFVIDRDRKVIAWNRAIEEMTGVAKEEIIGRSDFAYAVPFYGEARALVVDLVFNHGVEFKHQYDFIVKKGNTFYAEAFVPMTYRGKGAYLWIKASPLFDQSGSLIGAIESIRDITDRKKMEQALRLNAEKIKLFAYSVSHDLKSPIIGIHGLTRLLSRRYRENLDETGRNYCDQILKATEQAMALVEEINVYIRTKEVPLHFETFKPAEAIGTVRAEFGALLSFRRIKWSEPEYIPEIKADRLSFVRILRNLVDNALKYGGKKLSEIRIGYRQTADFHVFSVTDDGVGIKVQDSEKIFGVFQRDETSRGIEGTGLGLAIVKEIAEKHRGKVWVEPGAKCGTVFHVYISRHLQN